ncbi:hypothetical protein GDO86_005867 [Hymenochirus boettgeri]|uniref:Histone deacetylase domain-containing protein n=1 Tax=Hymenochirus boettgeri TaxID=247094 RepID=A0A8T2J8F1_9PIPI|nr:hypothetical protein GDO86_005867 [Hymenochirus boettgeri]
MNEEELKKTSEKYTAVFFHQNSYRCAKLSLGGTLQLVDAVMTGETQNGIALVRPPGHHSQESQGNGFCIFNNVAVAAKYAKKKYGLERILIVDWDVHHGQGIQYIFEEDPSVLYFSWHRYQHKAFWPFLTESEYNVVGKGKGAGFNINLPWNKVGMGNADYIAVFFHVLLPLAFEFNPELVLVSAGFDSAIGDPEGRMCATPECFSHLTHMLMTLAGGKLCAVLEGGYNLRSLSECVSMTVRTLLGDSLPKLTGEMTPCHSALESIQNVRAAHAPYWNCLIYDGSKPVENVSTGGKVVVELVRDEQDTAMFDSFLESHMKDILQPFTPVKTIVVVSESHCFAPPVGVLVEQDTATREHIISSSSCFSSTLLKNEGVLSSLGKMLIVLNKVVEHQAENGLVLSPDFSISASVAIKHLLHLGMQRLFCINIGDVDTKDEINNKGARSHHVRCGLLSFFFVLSACRTTHFVWVPVHLQCPGEYSSFFYVLFRFILPLAYNYQPDFIVITTGCNRSIGEKDISLLIRLLQGLANGRILAIISDTEVKLPEILSRCMTGDPEVNHYGPHKLPSFENIQNLKSKIEDLQTEWKLLHCSAD